jgi:hypothetical protein
MTIKAGDDVDAWCTKCKLDLSHRVVALARGVIQRVVCRTCSSEHRFRAPQGAEQAPKEARVKKKARATSKKLGTFHQRYEAWQDAVKGRPSAAFKEYGIGVTFEPAQLVRHKTFGLGYVVAIADTKLNVMFEDGVRVLAHGKK